MRRTALVSAAVLALLLPTVGSAGDLKVTLSAGRATIIADDVPVRTILQEWARVGQIRIVNADKLAGPPVTLRLIDVPEQDALEVLLRSASGYVAAPRAQMIANASQYDRIVILATSRPAATAPATATPPPQLAPYPQNPMAQPPVVEPDDDEPEEPNPATARPGITAPQPGPLQVSPQPGLQPQPPQSLPGQPPTSTTAPRPGVVPQPGVQQQPGAPLPVKPGGGGGD